MPPHKFYRFIGDVHKYCYYYFIVVLRNEKFIGIKVVVDVYVNIKHINVTKKMYQDMRCDKK